MQVESHQCCCRENREVAIAPADTWREQRFFPPKEIGSSLKASRCDTYRLDRIRQMPRYSGCNVVDSFGQACVLRGHSFHYRLYRTTNSLACTSSEFVNPVLIRVRKVRISFRVLVLVVLRIDKIWPSGSPQLFCKTSCLTPSLTGGSRPEKWGRA